MKELAHSASWRPMTKEEIAEFPIVPKGAVMYPDLASYQEAVRKLAGENVTYRAGSNQDDSLFWTLEEWGK